MEHHRSFLKHTSFLLHSSTKTFSPAVSLSPLPQVLHEAKKNVPTITTSDRMSSHYAGKAFSVASLNFSTLPGRWDQIHEFSCRGRPLRMVGLEKRKHTLLDYSQREKKARVMVAAVPPGDQYAEKNVETAGVGERRKEEEISTAMLIWRAVKLPIYTVALIPVMVGGAAAYYDVGVFQAAKFWKLLFCSACILAWLNLSNDGHDADTGVDKNKKESVVNMTGSRVGTLVGAYSLLAIAVIGIWRLASVGQDPRVSTLLFASIACGFLYQVPPFRLSYKGLGEPLCFFAAGPFATTAFYLSQARASAEAALPTVTPTVLGASLLVGITTSLILFCSHFHQIDDDRSAGKMSPLVRLGTERGSHVARAAVTMLFAAIAACVATKALPLSCMVGLILLLPLGRLVISFISENHTDKQKIFMAKYFAVRLHVAHGVALVLALVMGRMHPMPAFW